MSTGAPTIANATHFAPYSTDLNPSANNVVFDFSPNSGSRSADLWSQVDRVLRQSLLRSGFPQPNDQAPTETKRIETFPKWRVVAPGIIVSPDEYEQRFASLDLEHLRQVLPPTLFNTFVRHVGVIPGVKGLDVAEITDAPEVG